jgi:hypothetical protein
VGDLARADGLRGQPVDGLPDLLDAVGRAARHRLEDDLQRRLGEVRVEAPEDLEEPVGVVGRGLAAGVQALARVQPAERDGQAGAERQDEPLLGERVTVVEADPDVLDLPRRGRRLAGEDRDDVVAPGEAR